MVAYERKRLCLLKLYYTKSLCYKAQAHSWPIWKGCRMSRDMSNWPKVLVEALAPGVAPTLDRLAEETRRVFWSESISAVGRWLDTGEDILDVQDLWAAAITVLEGTPTEDKHCALIELWG